MSGATADDIENAIKRRMSLDERVALAVKYGVDNFNDVMDEVCSFHAGCEEIGTSDVSGFVRHFTDAMSRLPERNKA